MELARLKEDKEKLQSDAHILKSFLYCDFA
jgi:hypothetical protein